MVPWPRISASIDPNIELIYSKVAIQNDYTLNLYYACSAPDSDCIGGGNSSDANTV